MSFATRFLAKLIAVTARRLRRGPHHPEWGVLLETAVETLREDGEVQLAGTLDDWRRNQEASAKTSPAARGVSVREGELGGRPALVVEKNDGGSARGLILYLHGGGYCTGSPRTHRSMVSHLVAMSGVRAVLLDYRLAPEYPYPAAIDDSVAAIRALYKSGLPPAELVLAGDSAGAGLCLAAMMELRDRNIPMPVAATLLCPWVDLEGTLPSVVENVKYDWGDRRTLDFYAQHYARGKLRDPRVSPMHAKLTKLPPMLIQSGGGELMRDEARQLAENARRDGVSVISHEWPGMVHDWQLFAPLVPQSKAALAELAAFIRGHLSN
jgi:monoterpene epsilon-lactone hydrolase